MSPSHSNRMKELELRGRIVKCSLCPRLVEYRSAVKPRASYSSQVYWRRPVPGFGDLSGRLLIIGLAPASQGGLRTGRIFTGDASSRFLVRALHRAGFANQPTSESVDDGLTYTDCYITAALKCAPPGDRATVEEFANCAPFLDEEISMLKNMTAVLTLGSQAFKAYLGHLARVGVGTRGMTFGHGRKYTLAGKPSLYASYHPSPRNTNTGVLSQEMLVALLSRIRAEL